VGLTLISLDPPYELDAPVFTFGGWTEEDDEDAPNVALTLNGRPVAVELYPRPQARNHFPGIQVKGIRATVDFREALAGVDPQQDRGGFLLEATVTSDHRVRTFEYAVSEAWMAAVFGEPLKARPVPPAHLQIRVAGAAAGAFCSTGLTVAERVEAIAAEGGFAWPAGARVLDFGSGPGRLIGALQPRHPQVGFDGCDIDPEAIGWAQGAMAGFAAFAVNGHAPPLPYPDAAFDLVVTISIFTHLPEDQQFAWLDDLRRVLKPGGLLLATTMNPYAYHLSEEIRRSAEGTGFAYWGDAPATGGLPDFYRLAYHSHDYLRREWTRGFELLRIGDGDLNDTQDSVLLRRA
jgi:SAM-dependent methyltransferase